ncbi:helix-turn-helix domain-containing protein [Kocuria rhizophila]|uniref:helix-turn-helix domain-containing protein n=1 Tax=Kocuria rhizophila TaxID=72000 RepID=UPI00214FC3C9|nr:helix-turn-helix transcriptional regulator [Kocuria rhizophila]MCR4526558.1 helix-turn-helix domain-containing protein [Kocuria rhizophila]WSQ04273.1 helix-turn-helix domain-containing protein [Kocuria rhizophila]
MKQTVAEVVGKNFSALREDAGATLEDVARRARHYGLRWNPARVSRIDRGEGAITLDTALMLAVVLTDLRSGMNPVTLSDLLESEEPFELAPRATVRAGFAEALLLQSDMGEDAGTAIDGPGAVVGDARSLGRMVPALHRVFGANPGMTTSQRVFGAVMNMTLTDERNAKKMGLAEAEFAAWCVKLWGHLMSVETEQRAPEGATAQKKGRITRELMQELQEYMSREQTRGDD